MSSASKKQGTRVFKKGSPNGKITVYLGKRDFVDHVTHVDPIDGVVLVEPEYLKDRKVYGHVLAAFRYGREDLDVLGLTFRKDLYLASSQIFPPLESDPATKRPLTRLQERLIKKLGGQWDVQARLDTCTFAMVIYWYQSTLDFHTQHHIYYLYT